MQAQKADPAMAIYFLESEGAPSDPGLKSAGILPVSVIKTITLLLFFNKIAPMSFLKREPYDGSYYRQGRGPLIDSLLRIPSDPGIPLKKDRNPLKRRIGIPYKKKRIGIPL